MNKFFFIVLFLLSFIGYSQEDAWVFFSDKPNAQFYFDNPLQMLSQRSIERRSNQNIPLDIKDIPIHQPYVDQIIAASGIAVKAKSKWLEVYCRVCRGSGADLQVVEPEECIL